MFFETPPQRGAASEDHVPDKHNREHGSDGKSKEGVHFVFSVWVSDLLAPLPTSDYNILTECPNMQGLFYNM